MPIVQIAMMEGRTQAQKRAMVAAVTQAICDTLGADPKSVRIIINELISEHYAVAGRTAADKPLESQSRQGDIAEASA